MKKELQYNIKDSSKIIKQLFSNKSLRKSRDSLKNGSLFIGSYKAKNQSDTYDKRPFVLILRQNKSHILGLNFHYLPVKHRVSLIKVILKLNESNIKNKKPLHFSYEQIKPFLKKFGYVPCIRLYIRKRMSSEVVKINSEELLPMSKLNTSLFTNGVKPEQIYKMKLKNK